MKGHRFGSSFRVRRRPTVGLFDHQVNVQDLVGDLAERFDDRQSECQIRHEVVVHHVDVNPVGTGDPRDLIGELAEVEGHPEQRGLQLALEELKFFSEEFKPLGTFPANPFRRKGWEAPTRPGT